MSDPVLFCPYCHKQAQWLPDSKVYAKSYGGYVYACLDCDAHVGCHKQGDHKQAKGSLANQELRDLRKQAHALFDPFWQAARELRGWSKQKSRQAAYKWLAGELGMERDRCHIGMMGDEDCKRTIAVLTRVYESRKKIAA